MLKLAWAASKKEAVYMHVLKPPSTLRFSIEPTAWSDGGFSAGAAFTAVGCCTTLVPLTPSTGVSSGSVGVVGIGTSASAGGAGGGLRPLLAGTALAGALGCGGGGSGAALYVLEWGSEGLFAQLSEERGCSRSLLWKRAAVSGIGDLELCESAQMFQASPL
jgi:hypothetical protein